MLRLRLLNRGRRFNIGSNSDRIVVVKISATIISLNEEKQIGAALSSLDWVDEIVVVDSNSTDRTREIAESAGARVIINEWPGFSLQKQFAAEAARNDWILSVDADEVVTPGLRDEIEAISQAGPDADGYKIPRLAFYMGKPIRHSGWYPDLQLRLYDRRKGKWKEVPVHESVTMQAGTKVRALKNDLLHFSVENAAHHHQMIGERYAPLAAEKMFAEGRRTNAFKLLVVGPFAFLRSYTLKLGFLDGLPGIAIASFAAHHAFLKHLILWELMEQDRSENGS